MSKKDKKGKKSKLRSGIPPAELIRVWSGPWKRMYNGQAGFGTDSISHNLDLADSFRQQLQVKYNEVSLIDMAHDLVQLRKAGKLGANSKHGRGPAKGHSKGSPHLAREIDCGLALEEMFAPGIARFLAEVHANAMCRDINAKADVTDVIQVVADSMLSHLDDLLGETDVYDELRKLINDARTPGASKVPENGCAAGAARHAPGYRIRPGKKASNGASK